MNHHAHSHDHGTSPAEVVRDPVCGMTVNPQAGKPSVEHGGRAYYFCSAGCKARFEANPDAYLKAVDPVCGMKVTRATAKHFARHQGSEHYFCSAGCRTKFEAAPETYLSDRHPAPSAPKGTQYTCPMHPEIVRDGPGSCPKCGMALEPMGVPASGAGPNPELADFTRRFWASAALSAPLLVLTMGPMLGLPVREWLGERASAWVELLLASPVVLWAALPFFHRGYESIVNRSPNMFTLIAIGVGAAYLYSVAATVFPGAFPHEIRGSWRRRPGVFRGRSRHCRAGVSRPGAGTARPRKDRLGDPRAARSCAEDDAAGRRGWRRGRCPAGGGQVRRPFAHPSGRKRSGGWHRRRRPLVGRRIHADRRAAAAREGAG